MCSRGVGSLIPVVEEEEEEKEETKINLGPVVYSETRDLNN